MKQKEKQFFQLFKINNKIFKYIEFECSLFRIQEIKERLFFLKVRRTKFSKKIKKNILGLMCSY